MPRQPYRYLTTNDAPPEVLNDRSDDDLTRVALQHLRDSDKKTHQRLVKDGELDGYLQLLAGRARQDAQSRMERGVIPTEAWRLAIRTQILGIEED